jgi:hypothetical protein
MDNETNDKRPSSTEDRAMKVGDKVWVLCEVLKDNLLCSVYLRSVPNHELNKVYGWMRRIDCRPVEPDQDDHPVEFKVGDRVVSWSGRQGVVEAINEIEGFPITVRHSMREQVSYKLGGVKHDHHPVEPEAVEQPATSDPVNPSHYKQGGIECIEAMKVALGGGFLGYLRGNAIKYLWRYDKKNGVEDLKKARWYLDRLIQEEETK